MNRKILTSLVVFLVFSVLFFSGCSKTVATVNGVELRQSEVDTYIDLVKKQNPDALSSEDGENLKELESTIIDSLIVTEILEQYSKENGISVSEEEVEQGYSQIVSSYPSESDFEKELEEQGLSESLLKKELRNQILRTKVFEEVTRDVIVKPEEVKKYYEENKEVVFNVPEKVKVSHILVQFKQENEEASGEESSLELPSKKEALDKIKNVQDKLKNGESFEDLARKYSDDESSKESGGDIGYVSEGQLVEELDEVAFSLDVGEVSDIVETSYGFHLVKVTDREPPYIRDFEEVEDWIKNYLEEVKKQEKWSNFIYDLMEEAEIEYYTERKEEEKQEEEEQEIEEGK